MRALLFILPVAVALSAAFFIALAPFAERSNGDQVANRRVFEELRHPPGAEVIQTQDNPYFGERGPIFSDIPIGWTLNVTLRPAPGVTPEEVFAFYEQNPPEGWRVSVQETPRLDLSTARQTGSSRTLHYKRGGAIVSINVDNLGPSASGTYEIGIDHSPRR